MSENLPNNSFPLKKIRGIQKNRLQDALQPTNARKIEKHAKNT